ncbi:UDP-N-acetylmuramate: L-alanyl-gamma-D-glutamyl-meso-diaminopimelate ligase [Roseimicrobium gellanilyticum]|uniref:UDP-N-acetylmuramate: L-alanyl-gamma-D-glutamyl-meso-diaminopimelate ligase n=1 Tax=Roseimicrobium gellanilyticum TaxID=748857 RepID=A0A366HTP2_9BACT|nr:UDP-N-acetylmuramate:L-alanyl-gamma-D-glutamyl-meso-diaminopimelate ligase [Roseimicrobium gellanilyticum]RBP47210.1 UDP-N-acetylmuramate: L-alanyl-gamma-D-glutamyl-meso-diaminopimelate ligase [Roseimicrobium gellanilyticum]
MFQAKHFHFLGICGTAMGSTAAALRKQGHKITGSDNAVYPPMSTMLEQCGIELMSGYKPENLPAAADEYVVGNAISRGNPEVEALLERKLPYTSMAELLRREVMQGKRNFVVTGTHGKTTTTSILAWLLEANGKNPGYLIGGVPANFEVGARFTDSEYFVIEGDEYDTAFFDKRSKFLHYLPEAVIVNNIEFDHADIFNTLDDILLSFSRLLRIVPRNGKVFVNGDEATCRSLIKDCPAPIATVGTGEGNDIKLRVTAGTPEYTDFELNGVPFRLPMVGEFNARNAAMAVCVASFAGLTDEEIRSALLTFGGIKRRQTERGKVRGITIIDDFGHHPTAIRETLRGLRQRYTGARLWALFEPRSNTSRRNALQPDLIEALKEADGSIVAAVNQPEKVPPGQLLDVDAVVAAVCAAGRQAYHEPNVDAIIARLKPLAQEGDVVIVFSNGGFDGIHQKLLDRL